MKIELHVLGLSAHVATDHAGMRRLRGLTSVDDQVEFLKSVGWPSLAHLTDIPVFVGECPCDKNDGIDW